MLYPVRICTKTSAIRKASKNRNSHQEDDADRLDEIRLGKRFPVRLPETQAGNVPGCFSRIFSMMSTVTNSAIP